MAKIKNLDLNNIIKKYNGCRLHMPGHKGGKLLPCRYKKTGKSDITELPFSDNLLESDSIIKQAEEYCAACYNAEKAKFCTAGSTTAILSLLHSIRHLGKSIIIEKNSHKSVYSGLKLSGINPVIINNPVLNNGLYGHIDAADIEKAMQSNTQCIGALITTPDYFGRFADLNSISKVIKKYGKMLLIDASHGAHLPFVYKDIYKYADMYICSAHKTLPALTPASITLFNNKALYNGYLDSFKMFHTSSPSYPIILSIDYALKYMQKRGNDKLLKLKQLYQKYMAKLIENGFNVAKTDDFIKLTVGLGGVSGYDIYNYLVKNNVYCEMADGNYILAMFSVADKEKSFKKLYKNLLSFKKTDYKTKDIQQTFFKGSINSEMPYLQAHNSQKELVKLEDAEGRISACDVGFYPPSYPILCCGDKITKELCAFLNDRKEQTYGLVDKEYIFVVK